MPHLTIKRIILLRGGVVSDDTTPPEYSASEQGDVGNPILEVTFSENVNSAGGYELGVTIRYNAVAQTISSAARQDPTNNLVHYTLAADADINDVIDIAYDSGPGDIQDDAANDLATFTAQTATNYVGSHFYHNSEWDSGHLVSL